MLTDWVASTRELQKAAENVRQKFKGRKERHRPLTDSILSITRHLRHQFCIYSN